MRKIIFLILLLAAHINIWGQSNKLDSFIKDNVAKNNFNGTILIQKEKKVIFEAAFGKANRQFNIANTTNTKFKIASITKLFTSVLILQLYEGGKIDLNKTIKTYLPNYEGEAGDKVTIHQLLNHTSGMENIENKPDAELNDWLDLYGKPFTSDQILTKFCSGKLVNVPGKVFDYNNGEYIILGKIIEKIYNKPFEEVLKAQLLEPLKMANSGMFFDLKVIPNIADTYSWNDSLKVLENDEPVFRENWYSAGAMYSTSEDLLKFINSLFQYKILKKEALNLLITPGLDNYGYGVWIRESTIGNKKYRILQRFGSIRGTKAVIYRFLDSDMTIIMLSNTNTIVDLGPFALQVSKKILE